MTTIMIMQRMSVAMEYGVILKWLKKEGDKVKKGEPIVEIFGEKNEFELESPADGILLKNRRGEYLLPWLDIGEIVQGNGINRHKVSYTLLSKPPSSGINLGLCRFKFWEDYHLPSTFGMDAKELAADLEQTRKEKIQQEEL